MKKKIAKILTNWLTFMDMEKENKLRIDKGTKNSSKIKNEQYINYSQISNNNNFLNIRLTVQQYNIFINISKYFKVLTLPESEKIKFFKNDRIDDKIYFSSILLTLKYQDNNLKSTRYFYPLLSIPLQAFTLNKNDLQINSVNNISDYTIFKSFLTNHLLIDEEDIVAGENILEFISKLIGENLRDKNFLETIHSMSTWIEHRLIEIDSPFVIHKTSNLPDFLISQLDAEDYLKLIYNDLKNKRDNNYKALDYVTQHPLACSYLFDKPKGDINEPKVQIYKGAFGKFPLALGQAIVMQQIGKEEILTAVQGAPGTGKTTLLLSMIANRITQRALAIIKDEDFDNLMLITSTSNKAVDNISDAFAKDFSAYSWLYFIWGNGDKKTLSFNRLQKTIATLNNDNNSYNSIHTNDLVNQISTISKNIDNALVSYEDLKQKSEDAREIIENLKAAISIFNNNILIHNNQIKHSKKLIEDEYIKLLETKNYANSIFYKKFNDNITNHTNMTVDNEVLEKIELYKQNSKRLYKLLSHFNMEEITDNKGLFNKLYHNVNDSIYQINKSSFKILIHNLFGRKNTIVKNFIASNKDLVKRCFIKLELNGIDDILRLPGEIDYFNSNISEITLTLDECNEFNSYSNMFEEFTKKYNKSIHEINTTSEKIKALEIKSKQVEEVLLKKKSDLDSTLALFNENYKDGFLTYFKNEYHDKNVELFELSLKYIWQIILKNKKEILSSLEEWQHAMNTFGKDDRKSEFMRKLDIHKKNISLVYPVMTTTIASSMSLFFSSRPDIYDYLIVDEAGMITPNLLFPLLTRSKKAIVVGDPKQLEPIVTLNDEEKMSYKEKYWEYIETDDDSKYIEYQKYSPSLSTAYHRAAKCQTVAFDDMGDGVVLDEHRRCLTNIAKVFIDIAKYDNLKIKTLNLTPEDEYYFPYKNFGNKSLYAFDIQIDKMYDNSNIKEIDEIDRVLELLESAGFNLKKDIGIITPYRNQASKLISKFKKRVNHTRKLEKIGTVHKFQGAEFPIVLFSSVVGTNDSIKFINSKANMLNVAVSRAKFIFIVVGNIELLKKGTFSGKIINSI
jgi:superfamily I DNA and/or RNA helicase